MRRRIGILRIFVFAILFVSMLCIKDSYAAGESVQSAINGLNFERRSKSEIYLYFSSEGSKDVKRYALMRRSAGEESFTEIKSITLGKTAAGEPVSYTDRLSSNDFVKYEYRVDAYLNSGNVLTGRSIPASNVLICIDPGHYQTKNAINGEDGYGYSESMAVLKLGLFLRDDLKKNYGISSVMTRDTQSITIGGYTDQKLDSGHISLRGIFAGEKGADLFISLHTNANAENANGYPTNMQPLSINKPLIILNSLALKNDMSIKVANEIGRNVAKVNYDMGLANDADFKTVQKGSIGEWSTLINDNIAVSGSVYYRMGTNGDYYGVLRGSNSSGVAGMIVEHGFHTVPQLRKAAMESDLISRWSNADAKAIAAGFGF